MPHTHSKKGNSVNVLRNLILLTGVVSVVQFPIFVGHALSTHESGPLITAVVLLVVGIALLATALRLPDRQAEGH